MIRVLMFDLDDTLFAHRGAVADGILAHTQLLGRGTGGETATADELTIVNTWHRLEEHHYHRYLSGEIDYRGQRRARARSFLEPYGISLDDIDADEWFDGYAQHYRRAWKLHDDALPCLDALAHLRLGLITNGDLVAQTRKVDALGIPDRFEHLIASAAVGSAKPSAKIFQVACSEFGVPVGEAMYVGDRLQTDAIGAASAGLAGVWLDRDGAASADERAAAAVSGVRVIATLAELPPLVSLLA